MAQVVCIVLVVLSLTSAIVANSCDTKSSTKYPPFPGSHSIGFGYDITSGQTKTEVLTFEKAPHCAWYNPANQRYENVPKGITLRPTPAFSGSDSYVYMATSQQFLDASSKSKSNGFRSGPDVSLTVSVPEVPVKASTTIPPLFAAGAGSVTGHSSNLYKSDERSYGYSFQKRTTFEASITNTTNILKLKIVKYINANLPKQYDQAKYLEFIRQYGTHWVKDYAFGGLAMMEVEYMKYVETYQSIDSRQHESHSSFLFFFNHMTKQNSMAAQNSYKGKYTTTTSFYVTGGSPGRNWISSLDTNPAILSRGLSKFSVLVAKDNRISSKQAIASNLDKAVEDYVAMMKAQTPPPSPGPQDVRFPLVAYLFRDERNGGPRRVALNSIASLGLETVFDNQISSIEIYPGPGYKAYQNVYKKEPAIQFYNDNYKIGSSFVGTIGKISVEQLKAYRMENTISSLYFVNATAEHMPTIVSNPYGPNFFKEVPARVQLFLYPEYKQPYVDVIEDIADVRYYFGYFDNAASSGKVHAGNWPSGKTTATIIFYDLPNYSSTQEQYVCNAGADKICNIPRQWFLDHHFENRMTSIKIH